MVHTRAFNQPVNLSQDKTTYSSIQDIDNSYLIGMGYMALNYILDMAYIGRGSTSRPARGHKKTGKRIVRLPVFFYIGR
ncbi:hypothetical protein SAMN04488122_1454 [Chitinophaga arvensicola]|uniref:Uncharacterized protein n=1 Tax=Chitinophaga arvensicola TaxID=29529 RepID=A0A1I0QGL2_9BACT|nr:hypothetical protein SAMN04488122_1454 [Chitinophaga arvensicola]